MDSQMQVQSDHYQDIMLAHMAAGVALLDAKNLQLLATNHLFQKLITTYLEPQWHNGATIAHPITDWLPEAVANGSIKVLYTVRETGIPFRSGEFSFFLPTHGMTYWNLTVDPIRADDGHIAQLLITCNDITAQVTARRQVEQAQPSLYQEKSAIEAQGKQLAVIEAVARSVREALDIESVSRAAIEAINAYFLPMYVYTHIADPDRQALRLLHILPEPNTEEGWDSAHYVPYSSPSPSAKAHQYRDPIVIKDVQTLAQKGALEKNLRLVIFGARGYICIPLWFENYFEGTLSAIFTHPIERNGPEVQTLAGCATHLAAALAHARLHRAVQNEHARLSIVLDQLPEGALLVEASDGCISYANSAAATILGFPIDSLKGVQLNQHLQSHITTDLDSRPIPPWNFAVIDALCGETIRGQEQVVTRPDGSKVVILSSTAPLYAENNVITGAAIIFQDITAQKQIAQQKSDFLSIASHELRTPITAIQGFAEILHIKASRGENPQKTLIMRAVSGITEQSERLTQLIEEMLDISRIENAQLLLHRASHDLVATLKHSLENMAATTSQHRFQLILDGLATGDTLMGFFDENRIEQVLSNLLSNAIKYSPAGDEIEVGLRPISGSPGNSHQALIWIKDHGIGIPAADLPHIFERFHRASNLDCSISGLGLGLYLAQELINRHNGQIWAESTEGAGSTFFILLPLERHDS